METITLKEVLQRKERAIEAKANLKNMIKRMSGVKYGDKYKRNYVDGMIKSYSSSIRSYRKIINDCNKILTINSSFSPENLIPFLKECVSLKEQQPYTNKTIVLDENASFRRECIPALKNFSLIFLESLSDDVNTLYNGYFSLSVPYYLKLLKDNPYIIVENTPEIPMIVEGNLNRAFFDFPYLEDIGYDLIERRLNEPEKDEKQILQEELQEIKNNTNSKLIKE